MFKIHDGFYVASDELCECISKNLFFCEHSEKVNQSLFRSLVYGFIMLGHWPRDLAIGQCEIVLVGLLVF